MTTMCFSSPEAPTNPAPYSLDQSHTAVEATKAPVPKDPKETEIVTPGAPPVDKTTSPSLAGGSGAAFRM